KIERIRFTVEISPSGCSLYFPATSSARLFSIVFNSSGDSCTRTLSISRIPILAAPSNSFAMWTSVDISSHYNWAMREFFGPGGILEQRLKDYEYRPSQIRMAEAVHAALEQQSHVIIEAGTGTGKTLAYLLPALVHGRRLLVSTGTKTLQDQIFYKDIPLLESVVGHTIRAAYLKGRNNYLCRIKLEAIQTDGLFSPKELRT